MRVLITGADGQVGRELQRAFASHDVTAASRSVLDVSERAAVLAAIATLAPDAIVHAAAYTAVDACETDVDRAFGVNALGTRHVAEGAERVGAHLVYLSTDYVFDGTKPTPYDEWDAPNPQSVYGRSKYAGEQELTGLADATTVRIAWAFGVHGHNIVKTILRLAAEHETLRFVDDQRGRPTAAADVAQAIARLVAERRPGLFHATNEGEVSWFEFARAVMESAGLDPGRVEPVATADLQPPRPAPRPANSVLDDVALRLTGGPRLPHYRESLDRVVSALTR
jgi:dTDP-4-dehydrorhamnose reductase